VGRKIFEIKFLKSAGFLIWANRIEQKRKTLASSRRRHDAFTA
jgi:hypothetical protein